MNKHSDLEKHMVNVQELSDKILGKLCEAESVKAEEAEQFLPGTRELMEESSHHVDALKLVVGVANDFINKL